MLTSLSSAVSAKEWSPERTILVGPDVCTPVDATNGAVPGLQSLPICTVRGRPDLRRTHGNLRINLQVRGAEG